MKSGIFVLFFFIIAISIATAVLAREATNDFCDVIISKEIVK